MDKTRLFFHPVRFTRPSDSTRGICRLFDGYRLSRFSLSRRAVSHLRLLNPSQTCTLRYPLDGCFDVPRQKHLAFAPVNDLHRSNPIIVMVRVDLMLIRTLKRGRSAPAL